MRFSATRTGELLGDVAAGCEQLVHSSIADFDDRRRQSRLIGVLLAGPLLAVAAIALFLAPHAGIEPTILSMIAVTAVSWLLAASVALTGRDGLAGMAALGSATLVVAAVVAAAGGLGSPVAALVLVLPLEAWWVRRDGRAAAYGLIAALTVFPLQALFGTLAGGGAGIADAAHWIPALAYAALAAPRFAGLVDEHHAETPSRSAGVEELVDAVVLRMTASGEVIDASAQARTILGVAPELLLTSGFFDRIHVADRVAYMCALADVRHDTGRRSVTVRVRMPQAEDQTGVEYRLLQADMLRSSDEPAAIVALVRHNDEIETLRASLADAAEQAEAAEIAKSRFLAIVSHELRTPLNAIMGFSDMLLHEMFGPFQDKRQKEYVGLVRESGQHLLAIVNSMLDVSRIECGSYATYPEPFPFRDAAEFCHSMLAQQAAAKGVELTMHVPAGIGSVVADRRAVQQMLINLVANAVKFTPQGQSVAIGARRIGPRLHFWVSDTGIGMSEEELARVGKPFAQVHNDYTRQFDGAGLGLSLVKGLVKLHEGTMTIESEKGCGTTVSVSLPINGPARSSRQDDMPGAADERREDHDGTLRKTA